MSDSLWPHGMQHTQLLCPSPIPRAYSNSCPSSRWCHPGWLVRTNKQRARRKAIPPFLSSRPKRATNQLAKSVLENPEHLPSKESESEVTQLGQTLCEPMDCSLPGSSIHGIFQAGVMEWVAISLSRGSSRPRDGTWVSCTAGRRFTIWATALSTPTVTRHPLETSKLYSIPLCNGRRS